MVDRSDGTPEAATAALLGVTVLAGALISVQARVNGSLAERLGSSVLAALLSFVVGTVALGAVVLATRRWRGARLTGHPDVRWWWFCGGVGGALLVATSALAVTRVGVALLGVGIVAGQTVGSLAVDAAGLSPRGRQRVTAPRVTGVALAVAGLAVGSVGRRGELHIALFALIAAAGAGVAVAQAANGHVQRLTGEPLVAALVNFVVGTGALALLAAAVLIGRETQAPEWPADPRLYIGGLCGATYITLSAATVARLGVLRLTLASVAGQLLGALVLDALLPSGAGLQASTGIATAFTMLAVVASGRATMLRGRRR